MKGAHSRRARWPYTRRADGKIAVTLDNNVWDFLLENGIDLAAEFSADQFALFIPREVEIEASAVRRPSLIAFIRRSIEYSGVTTAATFGFDTGEQPHRLAPMGCGTFQSALEARYTRSCAAFLGQSARAADCIRMKVMRRSRCRRSFRSCSQPKPR